MDFNTSKIKSMVHYICRKMSTEPDKLGAVKLQKILWYTDIKSYKLKGESLTGATFVKNDFGPYLRELDSVVDDLVKSHKLRVRTVDYFSYDKREFIGVGEADLSMLEKREIRWLDENIDYICETQSAGSISDKTHDAMWKSADKYTPLPVSAAAIRFMPPSKESIAWAKQELNID